MKLVLVLLLALVIGSALIAGCTAPVTKTRITVQKNIMTPGEREDEYSVLTANNITIPVMSKELSRNLVVGHTYIVEMGGTMKMNQTTGEEIGIRKILSEVKT